MTPEAGKIVPSASSTVVGGDPADVGAGPRRVAQRGRDQFVQPFRRDAAVGVPKRRSRPWKRTVWPGHLRTTKGKASRGSRAERRSRGRTRCGCRRASAPLQQEQRALGPEHLEAVGDEAVGEPASDEDERCVGPPRIAGVCGHAQGTSLALAGSMGTTGPWRRTRPTGEASWRMSPSSVRRCGAIGSRRWRSPAPSRAEAIGLADD